MKAGIRTSQATHAAVLAAILGMLLTAACGGGSGGNGGAADAAGGDGAPAGDGLTPGADGATPGDGATGDLAPADAPAPDLDGPAPTLEWFGIGSPAEVMAGQTYTLRVRAYSLETATPLVGLPVAFELVPLTVPAGVAADASLAAPSGVTDAAGVATVDLTTGLGAGVVYTLTASARGAAAPLEVRVGAVPTGSLQVAFSYAGSEPVDHVTLALHLGLFCPAFDPGNPPADPLLTRDALLADAQVTFADLPENGAGYTVTARGFNAAGRLTAAGCVESGGVYGGHTTLAELDLGPLGQTLAGEFAATFVLDLGPLAPADLDAFYPTLEAALTDPAAAFSTEWQALVRERLPAELDEAQTACLALLATELDAALPGPLGLGPDWLAGLSDFAAAARTLLAAVTYRAALTVEQTAAGREFGLDWTEVELAAPAGPVTVAPAAWADTAYPWHLEAVTTLATITGYDALSLPTHAWPIETGRLPGYLLNEVLLPVLAGGARTLGAAAESYARCPDVVRVLSGDLTTCLATAQVSTEDLAADCAAAMAARVAPALAIVNGWAIPEQSLSVAATARLVDDDQDGAADRIVEGSVSGNGVADGNPAAAIGGTWEAQ